MDRKTLENMARCRLLARKDEFTYRRALSRMEADLELLKGRHLAAAYAEGVIDGKNADIRKRQEVEVLASSELCQEQIARIHGREDLLDLAQTEREYHDNLISLTKAWLYSQRPE